MGMTQPCLQHAAIAIPFEQPSQTPVNVTVASFFNRSKFSQLFVAGGGLRLQ